MIEHAMTFDRDKDGKLGADELRAFVEDFVRMHPGPAGRGGPGGPGGPAAPAVLLEDVADRSDRAEVLADPVRVAVARVGLLAQAVNAPSGHAAPSSPLPNQESACRRINAKPNHGGTGSCRWIAPRSNDMLTKSSPHYGPLRRNAVGV